MPNIREILNEVLSNPAITNKLKVINPEVTDTLENLISNIEEGLGKEPFCLPTHMFSISNYHEGLKDGYNSKSTKDWSGYYKDGWIAGIRLRGSVVIGDKTAGLIYGQLFFILKNLTGTNNGGNIDDSSACPTETDLPQKRSSDDLQKVKSDGPVDCMIKELEETNGNERATYGLTIMLTEYKSFIENLLAGRRNFQTQPTNSNPESTVDYHIKQGLMEVLRGRSPEVFRYEFETAYLTILGDREMSQKPKYTRLLRALELTDFGNRTEALREAHAKLIIK